MKSLVLRLTLPLLLLLLIISCKKQNANWTHFRGSSLNGIAQSYGPENWNENQNIKWKTALDGLAWSSPVVFDDQIWLTAATKTGDSLFAYCLDFNTGDILKRIDLFQPDTIQRIHGTNSYATPTPCIEEGTVYLHYGTYGTASINTKSFGINWRRTDLNCEHLQGAASSLVIYNDLLFVHLEGTDVQNIYAVNKNTGETVWKVGTPDSLAYEKAAPVYRKSYQTPIIIEVNGEDQLISNRALYCVSYKPNTGKENWRFYYGEDSTVGMPLFYNGLVLVNSGWVLSQGRPYFSRLFAIDPTGKGDITDTNQKWMTKKNVPQTSSPVIVDSLMFMIEERGHLSCLNPSTGYVYWEERLKGHFNISPLSDGEKVYFTNTKGETTVIKVAPVFEKLAVNKLDGMFKATPAILRNSMIVRSNEFVYRIQESEK